MKFLGDMGISPKSIAFLQSLGYDAVHLISQGLNRLPDPDILEKARAEERILLIHDLGFGDLLAASGEKLPSVIIFRLRNMRPDNVNQYLKSIIVRYRGELEKGVVMSVSEMNIRLHPLPPEKRT